MGVILIAVGLTVVTLIVWKVFFKEKAYELNCLTDNEVNNVALFFKNGWATASREGRASVASGTDKRIAHSVETRMVWASELDYIIANLEKDYSRNPKDWDERQIITKLKILRADIS